VIKITSSLSLSATYHIVADASFTLEDGTQIVYFYGEQSIVSTESSVVSTDDTQSFSDVIAKLPPVLEDLKVAPLSVEYFQVSPSFKPSIVIVLSLVMLSFFDKKALLFLTTILLFVQPIYLV
jgi:hypothetical protein